MSSEPWKELFIEFLDYFNIYFKNQRSYINIYYNINNILLKSIYITKKQIQITDACMGYACPLYTPYMPHTNIKFLIKISLLIYKNLI